MTREDQIGRAANRVQGRTPTAAGRRSRCLSSHAAVTGSNHETGYSAPRDRGRCPILQLDHARSQKIPASHSLNEQVEQGPTVFSAIPHRIASLRSSCGRGAGFES